MEKEDATKDNQTLVASQDNASQNGKTAVKEKPVPQSPYAKRFEEELAGID